MSTAAEQLAGLRVERWTPVSRLFTAAVGVLAVALFFVPCCSARTRRRS